MRINFSFSFKDLASLCYIYSKILLIIGKKLLKDKSHSGDVFEKRRLEFANSLICLFDISHKNALNIMVNGKDKEFLLDQRTERIQNIGVWSKRMNTGIDIKQDDEVDFESDFSE